MNRPLIGLACGALAMSTIAQVQPSLIITPPAGSSDAFSSGLAVAGDRIVVGDPAFESPLGNIGALYVFDAATGSLTGTIADPPSQFTGLGSQVVAEGDTAAVVFPSRDINARNVVTIDLSAMTFGPVLNPLDLAPPLSTRFGDLLNFASDGRLLVVGDTAYRIEDFGPTGAIHVFDLVTMSALATYTDPTSDAMSFGVYARSLDVFNGRILSYADGNGNVASVLDVGTGSLISTFEIPPALQMLAVPSGGFELTDRYVLVSSQFNILQGVYVFDVESGAFRGLLSDAPANAFQRVVSNAATIAAGFTSRVTPQGFVSGLEIFDEATGIQLETVELPAGFVLNFTLDLDDQWLAVGATDTNVLEGNARRVVAWDVSKLPRPCSKVDQAAPFGLLDQADVGAFIANYTGLAVPGDLAPPFGVRDLSDIDAFVSSFLAGCS